MRTTRVVAIVIGLMGPSTVPAVVDCHEDFRYLAQSAAVIVLATIESIGSREMPPCPDPKSGVFYPAEFRCGPLQTLDLHVERRIRGSAPRDIHVTLPGRFMGLKCDDPPTIEVGARIGLFLNSERDGFWAVSGVAGIFDVQNGEDDAFKARIETAARGSEK